MPKGNRREGPAKGIRARKGQLTWRKDPLILERVGLVRRLRAQHYSAAGMVPLVQAFLRQKGLEDQFDFDSTINLVYDDMRRAMELYREEQQQTAEMEETDRQRHIAALRLVIEEAWIQYRSQGAGVRDKARLLAVIRQAEESIGKFDRSFVDTVEVTGEIRTIQGLLTETVAERLAKQS